MTSYDAVILGAGPYGLSAAAHLSGIKGLDFRIFGDAMSFWDQSMPVGMYLRSNWTATQIADPMGSLTLEAFQAATGCEVSKPVPIERFIQYGRWFQKKAAPQLDPRAVTNITGTANEFRVTLGDGELVKASRVIVAAGIGAFARRPPEFDHIPEELASHCSVHRDLGVFAGKRMVIVGSGQSALESGALLHEAGAEVEILGRTHHIHWLQGLASKTLHHRLGKATSRLLYAPTDVGPAGVSQLMARPHLLRLLPRGVQTRLWKRCVRPAGARWLVDRLSGVPIRLGRRVTSAGASGDRIRIVLDDGSDRIVDHVLLGTGYRVDISKYGFLGSELVGRVQCVNGYPKLTEGLETSVPGLHILGAPAAWSYGPLMQFVSGARYASAQLTRLLSTRGRRA